MNLSIFEKYVLGVCHDIDELIDPNKAEVTERFGEFAARNFEGLFEKHPNPGPVVASLFNEWKTQMETEQQRKESRLNERIRYLEDRHNHTVRAYEIRGQQMQTVYEIRESHLNERLRYFEDKYNQTVRENDARTKKPPQETTTGDLWKDGLNLWAHDPDGAAKLFEAYVLSYPANKSKSRREVVWYHISCYRCKTRQISGLVYLARPCQCHDIGHTLCRKCYLAGLELRKGHEWVVFPRVRSTLFHE